MVPWALIPTAGRGTRLRPATAVVPKALLPLGTRPMLHWTLEEALSAGVRAVVVVMSPRQTAVREYLAAAVGAASPGAAARSGADGEALVELGRALRGVELHVVEQPEPVGIGDALSRCRSLTGPDPFAVLLPDNWFDAEEPAIRQVWRTFETTGLAAIGLVEVQAADAALLGNAGRVELEPLGGDTFRIAALRDKGEGPFRVEGREPVLRGVARYVLRADFYDALAATGPPPDGEWDDVPAFQLLVRQGRLAGHRLRARHFDIGQPAGFLAAAAYLFEVGRS